MNKNDYSDSLEQLQVKNDRGSLFYCSNKTFFWSDGTDENAKIILGRCEGLEFADYFEKGKNGSYINFCGGYKSCADFCLTVNYVMNKIKKTPNFNIKSLQELLVIKEMLIDYFYNKRTIEPFDVSKFLTPDQYSEVIKQSIKRKVIRDKKLIKEQQRQYLERMYYEGMEEYEKRIEEKMLLKAIEKRKRKAFIKKLKNKNKFVIDDPINTDEKI